MKRIDAIRKIREGKAELPEGVTEEQIAFTMEKHGLSREQVIAIAKTRGLK